MGYIACGQYRVRGLEAQMDRLYRELMAEASKPLRDGRDSPWVGRALQKSQATWFRWLDAECDLEDSLLGTGNASAAVAMDCRAEKLRARITVLKRLKKDK